MYVVSRVSLLAVGLLAVVSFSHAGGYLDDNQILEGLYDRMTRLDDSYIYDHPPLDDRMDELLERQQYESDPDNLPPDVFDSAALESRNIAAEQLRDQEHLENTPLGGPIRMSGGAGEGKQHLTPSGKQDNQKEVKSDEALPFYCHPPNPCPKGFNPDQGCDWNVQDHVDFQRRWINYQQEHGFCACDEEHMFQCPKGGKNINTKTRAESRDELDDMLESLFGDRPQDKSNNPYSHGEKRASLVAKKGSRPMVKRSNDKQYVIPDRFDTFDENPYLRGKKLNRVAKKGIQYKPAM